MTYLRTLPRTLGISLFSVLGFGVVAFLMSKSYMDAFDAAVIAFVQGWEHPLLTAVMRAFSFIGDPLPVVILAVCVLVVQWTLLRHRLEVLLPVIILGGAALGNALLKLLFHRQRPTLNRIIEEAGYSFPSGHSMSALALYATLAFLLWRHLPTRRGRTAVVAASCAMILGIGLSRIYLGVHYPSDVVGAYFASGFWFTLWVWLYQWYKEYRYEQSR
ncbi:MULTISPECIES: phosphatase PAP2 family protein [Paenibacillus]|uniref:phosphatase PAP2 family protein n=1 Tax=Paenibacillus TaxID=44249 RepID=UPI0022B8CFC5|nr:phosphatase PAP2 family protein [Paenibacillus caseinilyticus]MCZ8520387.1 phosphatase PAP2 family protein [Paenibacillus caseinilyticus]